MQTNKTWADKLWGSQAKLSVLLIAAAVLLFLCLGCREIWTQEHRWADIVSGMFYRHDYLHPYLNQTNYYDKPLLSYWLIVLVSFVTKSLTAWTLRLPSAAAGLLSVFATYSIGKSLKDKSLGLLSGWMLVTTFYFVFWAKTSSADMLNLAGTLSAIAWYLCKKEQLNFINYAVFFLILALTCLCKGLIGAVIPVLVMLPDLLKNNAWKKHLRWSFVFGLIPAAIVYLLPFWASSHYGSTGYQENGLYLVFRENVVRYFHPFDHQGPIYTYFIFLPVYLLPWVLFFIPALTSLPSRWNKMSHASRWTLWTIIIIFVFLTMSGSRRNYYVLPLAPFAIIFTADWILETAKRGLWAGRFAVFFFAALFLNYDVLQPLYYAGGGASHFEPVLSAVLQAKPERDWSYVMLDPESKVRFYLHLSPDVREYLVKGARKEQTAATLLQAWPLLKDHKPQVIFITRKQYEAELKTLLPDYDVVEAPASWGERVLHIKTTNAPVAFIPHF